MYGKINATRVISDRVEAVLDSGCSIIPHSSFGSVKAASIHVINWKICGEARVDLDEFWMDFR